MKLTFALFLLYCMSGIVNAQDTIRTLVISETRIDHRTSFYVEFTNMGDNPIELSQFEIGKYTNNESMPPISATPGNYARLPEKILQPGECYLMCSAQDYHPEQFAQGNIEFPIIERLNKPDLLDIADYVVHLKETGAETDSVDLKYSEIFHIGSSDCFYLEQHLPNGDSVFIDQVNGVFNGPWFQWQHGPNDVAGYTNATATSTIIRKHNIVTGNPDFFNARGIGEDDSEWIVVPNLGGPYRKLFWTAGNHINAVLNENTLESISNELNVDFANKTITVPWGTRRADDVMAYFQKKEGIAWNYHLNTNPEDSLLQAAKTGDRLEIFVCGDKVQKTQFAVLVSEPPVNANKIIPVDNRDPEGNWRWHCQAGILDWPRVTRHNSGMDTITGYGGGIPFATRTDSLLERLEKALNAKWEFEWVDGVARPDLKNGDILKVTAENGEVKRYYISVLYELKSHNAFLSSITWPDIPMNNPQIMEWENDTIPGFIKTDTSYILKVPSNINLIPALVAKTENVNAFVHVKHAKSLSGTSEDRTISFIVTAEDDSTVLTYTVELIKKKLPENIQPFEAEPFLSELVSYEQGDNGFGEICNPGSVPLDLSNYMIAMVGNPNPAEVIKSRTGKDEWLYRYDKYVPGYKWVNEYKWQITPGILEPDLSVNPIIEPGDVFCFGAIFSDWIAYNVNKQNPDYSWPVLKQLDIQFNNFIGNYSSYKNPWNEPISENFRPMPVGKWWGTQWYLFKILNDSIKLGLKPANDPNDFELLESFGMTEIWKAWVIAGYENWWAHFNFIRKPEFTKPNPQLQSSFGTNENDCEWIISGAAYWFEKGLEPNDAILAVSNDIGQHSFIPITHYMSTVSSVVYKVSEAYSLNENIRGMKTGITVGEFLSNIIKADSGQVLTIKGFGAGNIPEMGDLLQLNDTLIVLSADSTNTTRYILEVTEQGLSSQALLTSDKYDIILNTEPGTINEPGQAIISGFEYGTSLKTVLDNVNVPFGALISAISNDGEYISVKRINYNDKYVYVTVNPGIYLEVIAEDGITTIDYQLHPESSESDAFLLSDVYAVSQKNLLINYLPRGTNVLTFLSNIVTPTGATVKIVNKMNQDRTEGEIYQDDKVIVTSANGNVVKVYYISMLAEKYIPETTYLAYILSDEYMIKQIEMIISQVPASTTVNDFYLKIKPAIGATAVVLDKDGVERITGNISETDIVKVTSLDGKTVVYYTFDPISPVIQHQISELKLYPNPTDGKIYIEGIVPGTRIIVINVMGSKIKELVCESTIETVSLKEVPSGLYQFYVFDGHKKAGSFKIIKR